MVDGVSCIIWVLGLTALHAASLSEPSQAPTITNAAQLLALPPEQAALGLPVRLRGMVTYYEPPLLLFVQDETGGVFVYDTGPSRDVKSGQYVEVTGLSNQGRFTPIVDGPAIRTLKTGP